MNNRISISTIDRPQFVNLQPLDINPLMSRCEVKVLYIGQNRNRSSITKEVATEMSKTLRGCPIVGYYLENKEDFGDHGDQVIIDGEGVKFKKLTKPYGFVAPDAKVWFQFFEDQDEFGNTCLREYLMTEGYLWTGQFEECKRVLTNNNPQSMELDEESLQGNWATDYNSGVDFFIINDAIFSKLCILGDDVEPCFEGANVSAPNISSNFNFNMNDDFTKSLFTMMNELKFALQNNEGGKLMHGVTEEPIVKFEDAAASEGGDASDTSAENENSESTGTISIPEESTVEGEPAISGNQVTDADTQTDVELNDTDMAIINSLTEDYIPAAPEGVDPETIAEAVVKDGATNVPTQILQNACAKEEDDKKKFEKKEDEETDKKDSEKSDESQDKSEKSSKENSDNNNEEEKDKKKNFSLEDYETLQSQYSALEVEYNKLVAFKQEVENKQKDELIASFYMLSEEDKKDVIENKVNYSLDDIEKQLSVICVRKKVNFNLVEDNEEANVPTVFNLDSHEVDSTLPAWLKAVEETKNRK